MKYTKKIMAAVVAVAVAVSFIGCVDNDYEDQLSNIELPASVGENPFAGKTFSDGEDQLGYSSYWSSTWVFDDSTFTETDTECNDGKKTIYKTVYNYSYDTEKSLLYFTVKSDTTEDGTSFSSISEYKQILQKSGRTGTDLENRILYEKYWTSSLRTCKYKIQEGNLLSLEPYFTGTLPSNVPFYNEDGYLFNIRDGIISYVISDNNWKDWYDEWSIHWYTTFENGNFQGKIYKIRNMPIKDEDDNVIDSKWSDYCEYIGTVSGTYECSGTGTKGCEVTITVTELPETVTEIEKNKPLVFKTADLIFDM